MGNRNQEKIYSAVIFNAHFLARVPLSWEDAPFLLFPLLLVFTSDAPISIINAQQSYYYYQMSQYWASKYPVLMIRTN